MAAERIIGVDFGTSTSVIRVKRYENGKPLGEALETREVVFGGGSMVPTLVMRKEDDASVSYFGYEAQQKKKRFNSFHSFKMDLESADPAQQSLARDLTEAFYHYLARQYKSQSEGGHLGSPSDKERTIISYPVKWREETKRFMVETAIKAGFPNVTGMDEAQAAIQAVVIMSAEHLQKHGLLQAGVGANILLIDMGAGTTDLVLARYCPGSGTPPEVLNTWPRGGSIQFGGREIDSLLQGYFRKLLQGEDEDTVEKVFRRIGTDKFKSWKEETVSPALRKNDPVSDFAALDERLEDEEIDLEYCLDRASLEDCLADYLRQFPELMNGCLHNAGMSGSDVDLVIVTGGHSQWYFVQDMLAGKLPRFGQVDLPKIKANPARIVPISRPQETVALGLAYSGLHTGKTARPANAPAPQPATQPKPADREEPAPAIVPARKPVPKPADRFDPEEVVKRYVASYPADKLEVFSNIGHGAIGRQRVHLQVPPEEQALIAKDCTLLKSGKSGTIITPRGIYVRNDFAQPDYISWLEFTTYRLIHEQGHSTIFLHNAVTDTDRLAGYFLGSDCTQEAFHFYQGLQRRLIREGDFSAPAAPAQATPAADAPAANTYTVPTGKTIFQAAMTVKEFFAKENMEVHHLVNDGVILVQARAIDGSWQQWLGLDKAISVRFSPVGTNRVTVEIGGGKWVDKALSATVHVFLLSPLALLSGLGAIQQAKLLKDARRVIETYFYSE